MTAAASCHRGQESWAADPVPGALATQPEGHQAETHGRSQTTPLKRLLGFLGFGTPSDSRDRHTKEPPLPLKRARLAPSLTAEGGGRPAQAAHLSSMQATQLSPRQWQDLAALTSLLAAHGSPGSAAGSPQHLQQTPEAQGSPCTAAVAAADATAAGALMLKEWSTGSQPRHAQAAEPDAEEQWVGHRAAALAALDASPASISSDRVLRVKAHARFKAAADQPDSLQPGAHAGTICIGQDASSQAATAAPPGKFVSSPSGSPGHHGRAGLDIGSQTSNAWAAGSLGEAVPQVSRTPIDLGGTQDIAEAETADGPGSTAAAFGPSTETEMQISCRAEVISPSRRLRFRRLRAKPGSRGLVFVRQ